MTDHDATRIHARLDEIVEVMGQQAVTIGKLSTSFDNMVAATARSEVQREQTCPHLHALQRLHSRLDRQEHILRILQWFGGIVTVALLIPGVKWFGERLFALLIG